MADEVASPVVVTAPAQTTADPPATAAPLGKASDLAKELAAADAEKAPLATAAPMETPDELSAKRIARIARANAAERAKVATERAKFETEQKEALSAAAKWRELEEAKGKGDQLAVLRKLYKDEEITEGVYRRLTDHIYNAAPAETLSRADVAALVEEQAKKLESDRIAAEEAKHTNAEKARAESYNAAEVEYLGTVGKHFGLVADKFPWIKAFPVTGNEIVTFIRDEIKNSNGQHAPLPEEIFAHFEKERSSRAPGASTKDQEPQSTITHRWKNDAPPTGARTMSLKESLELAKREALGK